MSDPSFADRVRQFKTMSLPGQPKMSKLIKLVLAAFAPKAKRLPGTVVCGVQGAMSYDQIIASQRTEGW